MEQKELKPKDNIEDFITLIDVVFRFTGSCFDPYYGNNFVDYVNIQAGEDCKDMTTLDLFRFIYRQPLTHDVRFIRLGYCGCNMGYCNALVGIDIDNSKYETYGDLMKLFGDTIKIEEDSINEYYSYPDSVMFSIRRINKLPPKIHRGSSCCSEVVPVGQKLDLDVIYLAWEYNR